MRHYRSSIPKEAKERILATHISGPQNYLAEYVLNGEVVGVRHFDKDGRIESERPLKNGWTHGTLYFFEGGKLHFSEHYVKGLAHGTAKQWSEDGDLIGTYSMSHGTGLDLWRRKDNWGTGKLFLAEARYLKDGMFHGFEWWLNEDQKTVDHECHFWMGQRHGIERMWNDKGRLKRGYPQYWVKNQQVTKRRYLRERVKDSTLPPFRKTDNRPNRSFPPAVKKHLM